jgi:hypothetical protein
VALAKARNALKSTIADADTARKDAQPGPELDKVERLLLIAREAIQGRDIDAINNAEKELRTSLDSLPAPAPTPVTVPTPQDASSPTPQPAQPIPEAPSTQPATTPARASGSVSCSSSADVTFHATGTGTVTITSGGETSTESSAAEITVHVDAGQIIQVTATADDNPQIDTSMDESVCMPLS